MWILSIMLLRFCSLVIVEKHSILSKIDSVWRPSEYCKPIPSDVCAVVYDSHDCYSGWSMNISSGPQLKFKYFSFDWKYRLIMKPEPSVNIDIF